MTKNYINCLLLLIILFIVNNCLCYKPLVIAHRAASGYLPEQTLEANVMAYMMNTDYIELDVILSKDNHLIVSHDVILDETTNVAKVFPNRCRNDSHYYTIDFTYDELKQLRVSERFTNTKNLSDQKYPNRFPLWKSSFQIHNLAEQIELIEGLHKTYKLKNNEDHVKNVSFLIEIKRPYFHKLNGKPILSEILLETLDKYGHNNENSLIILQSFDPYELMYIKNKLNSKLKLVQLLLDNKDLDYEEEFGRIDYDYWNSEQGLRNISTYAMGIATEKGLLIDVKKSDAKFSIEASKMYEKAKELNLKVFAWTFRLDQLPAYVDNFEQLLNVFVNNLNIDGIITDFPGDVVSFLNDQINNSSNKIATNVIYIYLLLVCLYLQM